MRAATILDRGFIARTLRFAAVGLIGSGIYIGLAFGLNFAGLNVLSAHTIAVLVSLAASYGGQKIFTFGMRGQHQRAGPRFVIATVLLVAVQYGLVGVLELAGLADHLILLASTLYYPPASYLIHTFWTFRPAPSAA